MLNRRIWSCYHVRLSASSKGRGACCRGGWPAGPLACKGPSGDLGALSGKHFGSRTTTLLMTIAMTQSKSWAVFTVLPSCRNWCRSARLTDAGSVRVVERRSSRASWQGVARVRLPVEKCCFRSGRWSSLEWPLNRRRGGSADLAAPSATIGSAEAGRGTVVVKLVRLRGEVLSDRQDHIGCGRG